MTDQRPAVDGADDATLLNMVRAGDSTAFEILRQRHDQAARRLARSVVASAADVDDVVSETFARVLSATALGGGPTDAFRPYLLIALRRVCHDRRQGRRSRVQEHELHDLGELFDAPAAASRGKALIVRAFLSLPGRWIAVLWHTAIEQEGPAEIAPLFGLGADGLAALQYQATESIRQAYLRLLASAARADCKPVTERLGAFVRYALSARDTSAVTEHLLKCTDCNAAYLELADLNLALRRTVAPVVLGSAAAAYLSGPAPAAAPGAAPAHARAAADDAALGGSAGAADARSASTARNGRAARNDSAARNDRAAGGAVRSGKRHRTRLPGAVALAGITARLRTASGPARWLAASLAGAVGIAAVAVAVTLTGHSAPSATAGRQRTQAASAQDPASLATPPYAQRPGQEGHRSRAAHHRRSRPDKNTVTPAPPVSPPPSPTPAPAVGLTASIDILAAPHGWSAAAVAFTVSDTGSAGTGDVTASITLPSGSSMISGGHGGNDGSGGSSGHGGHGSGGWSCQPTASGATCQHGPIAAGSQSSGLIFIAVSGSAACGQPVEITASSGGASGSGQSSGRIPC